MALNIFSIASLDYSSMAPPHGNVLEKQILFLEL